MPAAWPSVGARGADQRTPNLAPVVQEIVARPGWVSGNALVLVVTGTGTRTAEAFEGGAARAPVLHIEYASGTAGPPNAAPVVNAGPDVAVTRPDAGDAGRVGDRRRAARPAGAVTAAWTKVTGPGTVVFADAAAASTTATFSAAGELRAAADRQRRCAAGGRRRDGLGGRRTPPGRQRARRSVSAGRRTVAVTRPTAADLAGSVTDDGLPAPPGLVTAAWSKVSGPGTVAFADAAAASTTATFSAAGSYVLRLTGDDGALTVSDDVTVTVSDPAPPPGVLDVPVRAGADDAEERIVDRVRSS